jgi:glycosyltransferase involved in cell wall biosynthesis
MAQARSDGHGGGDRRGRRGAAGAAAPPVALLPAPAPTPSAMSAPLRVLAVRGDLETRLVEASEVWQYLAALDRAAGGAVTLSATDCTAVSLVDFAAGAGELVDARPLWRALACRFDVVAVFGPLPWRQLAVAAVARLRGARVVLFPLALLTRDFAQRSWYRTSSRAYLRMKPVATRALAWLWARLATVVCCASEAEVVQSRFPAGKVALVPWPFPDTPLAAVTGGEVGPDRTPDGPVAVVSRWDPWRKGFDRLCDWLETAGADLPRPAVMLLVPPPPADDPVADRLRALEAAGLVEWDTTSTGPDLLACLRRCRGVLQLSRWEGQPRALREALLLGLPVATTAGSHLTEVLDLVGGGVVVDGDDPAAISAAFERLGRTCVDLDAVRRVYAPERIGAFLVDLLSAVAAHQAPPQPSYYRALAGSSRPPA